MQNRSKQRGPGYNLLKDSIQSKGFLACCFWSAAMCYPHITSKLSRTNLICFLCLYTMKQDSLLEIRAEWFQLKLDKMLALIYASIFHPINGFLTCHFWSAKCLIYASYNSNSHSVFIHHKIRLT